MRIYLIGFMGVGKTHWGKILSNKLGLPFYDLDELIEQEEGRSVSKIFEEEGEEYFRTKERDVLRNFSEQNDSILLSCGGGAPCFFNNINYMNEMGVTVWINAPFEILLGRLRLGKDKRPLLKNLSDEQLKAYIVKKNADRRIYYEQAKVIVDDHVIEIEKLIKQILHA
ncbi:MAG: shikimate kinase [Niabella sp.]